MKKHLILASLLGLAAPLCSGHSQASWPAGLKHIAWFCSCPSGLTYTFVFHPGLFKPIHFITGSLNEFPLMEEMYVYATGH